MVLKFCQIRSLFLQHFAKRLDLSANQLKELPTSLGNLAQLETLWLSDNQLKELPASLGNLAQLEDLDLAANQLKELPVFLGNLAELKQLYLKNNPIQFVPKELKTSSIAAIRNNKVIKNAQVLPSPTLGSCRTPEEEPEFQASPPSPYQQIVEGFYACWSWVAQQVAAFASWAWTCLQEIR